jgi:hypothetical protein
MAKGKTTRGERKTPVRMGKLGDAELAAAIQGKLLSMIRPLSTRPKFKSTFDKIIGAVSELGTVTDEPTPTGREGA